MILQSIGDGGRFAFVISLSRMRSELIVNAGQEVLWAGFKHQLIQIWRAQSHLMIGVAGSCFSISTRFEQRDALFEGTRIFNSIEVYFDTPREQRLGAAWFSRHSRKR